MAQGAPALRTGPIRGSPMTPRLPSNVLLHPLVSVFVLACSQAGGESVGDGYPYAVGEVGVGDIAVTVEETGVVEPERQVVVKSPISGIATRLEVREGDSVQAGQLMATLVPDIAQANALASLQSEIESARIAVQNLKREYERASGLEVGSAISESELEQYRTEYEQARNRLGTAEEQLRLMEQSGVRTEGRTQSALIRAPVSGIVITKGVEEGEAVTGGTSVFGGGTELFTIADLSTLLIRAAVNEVDIGKVAEGDTVAISSDAFPGDTAFGVVRLVPPAARLDDRIRVFDVEIEVRDGAGILRPGMTANVSIAGPTREGVVRVPVEAVQYLEGEPVLYLLAEGGPRAQPVKLGLSNLAFVEITEGVTAGDSIALEDPVAAMRRAAGQ
jgi:RND family efflux transporter MFP subunit